MKILFVCNANIVRSFLAERILRSRLDRQGRGDISVASAGLMDLQGAPADETARQLLRESGIDDEGHRSRVLTEEIVADADLIVTMESRQARTIGERFPGAVDKVRVLKAYLEGCAPEGRGEDVADPYKRSLFHYRLCYADITLALEELRKCI